MQRTALFCSFMLVAGIAFAVTPGTDLYLPSVAHGRGVCPGGVCSQWRTDVWVFNPPDNPPATVTVSFLERDVANTAPATQTLAIESGEVKEILDAVDSLFERDSAYGALRFVSDVAVVVSGRIYDANVPTSKGIGTAGQLFIGLPAAFAIGNGESTDLIGLAQDASGAWRSNFGFVETAGAPATVEVQRLDGSGNEIASKVYTVREREAKQFNIGDIVGPAATNQRLRIRVTEGVGRILAFGSRLDNVSGDPSTVEMTVSGGRDGTYLCKIDKTQHDTALTLTVANGKVTALDATVLVTSVDIGACTGGELIDVAGALPEPVVIDEIGNFSFSTSGSRDSLTATLQITGVLNAGGRVTGTVVTTLSGAGSCSGSKSWPLVGARLP